MATFEPVREWVSPDQYLALEERAEGEAYDRGDKFGHYQMLPSLREYVLVASDRRRMERFIRQDRSAEWVYSECSGDTGSVPLTSVGSTLSLPRVYGKVQFPEREPGRRRGPE